MKLDEPNVLAGTDALCGELLDLVRAAARVDCSWAL